MTAAERDAILKTVAGLRAIGETVATTLVAASRALERADAILDAAERFAKTAPIDPNPAPPSGA